MIYQRRYIAIVWFTETETGPRMTPLNHPPSNENLV